MDQGQERERILKKPEPSIHISHTIRRGKLKK